MVDEDYLEMMRKTYKGEGLGPAIYWWREHKRICGFYPRDFWEQISFQALFWTAILTIIYFLG